MEAAREKINVHSKKSHMMMMMMMMMIGNYLVHVLFAHHWYTVRFCSFVCLADAGFSQDAVWGGDSGG